MGNWVLSIAHKMLYCCVFYTTFISSIALGQTPKGSAIVRDPIKAENLRRRGFEVTVVGTAKDSWPDLSQREATKKKFPAIAKLLNSDAKHDGFWADELIARAAGNRYSNGELSTMYPEFPAGQISDLRKFTQELGLRK